MLAIERKNSILSILQEEKNVVVAELSKKFDVSEETIRRDLEKLEKEGFVIKTYGGAYLNENLVVEMPSMVRKKVNVIGKQKIAHIIASMISDNDTITLDASSTALYILQKIKSKNNITLLTNSIEIIMESSDIPGWTIISTGGHLMKQGILALTGSDAESIINSYQVDKSIISCKAVSLDKGFMDSDVTHANTKRCMLENCNQKIMAVDSCKFDKTAFVKMVDFELIDVLVTDKYPNDDWLSILNKHGIKLIVADEDKGE